MVLVIALLVIVAIWFVGTIWVNLHHVKVAIWHYRETRAQYRVRKAMIRRAENHDDGENP